MLEALQVIALLCQVASGGSMSYTQSIQLDCQQKYINCLNTKTSVSYELRLERCVLEKKL